MTSIKTSSVVHALAVSMLAVTTSFAALPFSDGDGDANASASDGPLAATFAAHGGLDRFRAQGQLSYTMKGFPLSPPMARPNRSTVDLHRRFNRIDGDGFVVGFDGKNAWSTPGPNAVGMPPRFVTLGSFYFIGMPFVFGDDGVVVTQVEDAYFLGQRYRVYQIGYERGIGFSSSDDYSVFIDPESDRLAIINHSVTENPDVDRVTWVFNDWQDIDGLLVPARMTFYPGWNPENPGEGHSFTIEDVRFATEAPDHTLFEPPSDAVIDDSPAVY